MKIRNSKDIATTSELLEMELEHFTTMNCSQGINGRESHLGTKEIQLCLSTIKQQTYPLHGAYSTSAKLIS